MTVNQVVEVLRSIPALSEDESRAQVEGILERKIPPCIWEAAWRAVGGI